MDAFVFGFVLQERTLPGAAPEQIETMTQAMLEHLPAAEYPNMRDFGVDYVLAEDFDFGKQFDWGLDLLLDGIAKGVEPPE